MIRTAALLLFCAATTLANHPVLVEGERDFDGDGLIGAAEDTDNATDRVFGTLTAALGALNGAANQNGRIMIVTSGRFPEMLLITGANGNVTIEAAPGVEADVDAVLAGAMGNAERQGMPGIVVNAPATRIITLRNLVLRNWAEGIQLLGASRVVIDGCRLENNRDHGIRVAGSARATITGCHVNATGFRVAPNVNNTPAPGVGVAFEGASRGVVAGCTISGSFRAGLLNVAAGSGQNVQVKDLVLFDNSPDLQGAVRPLPPVF